MTSYEAKRLLNLDEEPAFENVTTMSHSTMSVITETTWKSSNPANPPPNPPSTSISRANSDLSMYVPVRRRSVIQTPGVATRANSIRNSPAQSRRNYRFSHPPTPNLSRQQSFESNRSGVISMPPRIPEPDAIPRVVTPCEDGYQSIGAFKLGSLRITNGAASPLSPEPEIESDAAGKMQGRSDYFQKTQAHEASALLGWALRAEEQSEVLPKVEAPQSLAVQPNTVPMSFVSVEVTRDVSASTSKDSANSAAEVSQQCLSNLHSSPLFLGDQPQPISPKLETTSKIAALDDQLFEDEAQPEYASVEVLDVRLDPNAKSQPGQVLDVNSSKAFSRADSGFISIKSPTFDQHHKPLAKADSGYSSNVSLRSFQLKSEGSQRNISMTPQSEHVRSGHEIPSMATPQREPPPPPPPPKDLAPSPVMFGRPMETPSMVSFPPGSPVKGMASPQSPQSPLPISRPSTHASSPKSPGPRSPESIPRTPGRSRSGKPDASGALSISTEPQKPGKLQRLISGTRRSTASPLTVHTTHVSEKSAIPSIPQDVEFKLRERTGLFPITTKRLALKPRSSKDTLKTIFSVGSVEASLDAVASIRLVPNEANEAPEARWRHTLNTMPTSIAHIASQMMPTMTVSKKPSPTRQNSVQEGHKEVKTVVIESIVSKEPELTNNSLGNTSSESTTLATTISAVQETTLSTESTSTRRTMSLTTALERTLNLRLTGPRKAESGTRVDVAPALPSPLLARALAEEPKSSTPPPVSMMNRRPASLRVPPPLRYRSSTPNLGRGTGRENLRSYPYTQPTSRNGSREDVQGYSPYLGQSNIPPTVPPMDPRRFSSFRQLQNAQVLAQPRMANWNMQVDNGIRRWPSQTSLDNGLSRRTSSSSDRNDQYGLINRPASAQAWHTRPQPSLTLLQPPLRHRSSYDGYTIHQQRNLQQYPGYPPAMSNGYTAPLHFSKPARPLVDPWNGGGNMDQFDPTASQWSASDGPYPPYVPRGHYRNRSAGSSRSGYGHGHTTAPYRVLHSYNSPAYRNVPIWG